MSTISHAITETLDRLERGEHSIHQASAALSALSGRSAMTRTRLIGEVAASLAEREAAGGIDAGISSALLAALAGDPASQPRKQLAQLQDIVQAASAHAPLSERLPRVTELVTAAMEMDGCTVFLRDEATNVLALRAAKGMDPSTVGAVTLRIGRGIVGLAAQQRRTIATANAPGHPNYFNHPGLTGDIFATQLSSPLVADEQQRLVGVISVHRLEPRQFTDADIEFLETVAGVLAVAVDNSRQSARTDDQLRRKVAELATLQRVSRVIASSLDETEVLKLITEQAVELIQAEAAAIFRLPDDVSIDAGHEPNVEYRVGRVRSHEDQSARDDAVREVLSTGVARTRAINYEDGVSTLFCLPLNTARETVGALCFRLGSGTALDEEQLGLLQAFGDAAALAIENARLYQEAVAGIETKTTLVQEMHHRVRNNLQTVAALLSLQLRSEPEAPWTFELGEAVSRIQAIAGVHDLMSDESRLAGTTVDVLARMVAEEAHSTLTPPGLQVRYEIPPSDLRVPSRQATIIALLINELTANAIHHGFAGREHGLVRISAREDRGNAVITVFNDGRRIPKRFDPARSDGLGMRITQRLVSSDLRGTFTIEPTPEGTVATIRFPLGDQASAGA
jgi:two-component sensor histidine kinase/putative methionine-R-sulfoxide reductase with GAF domain